MSGALFPSRDDIEAAAALIGGRVRQTPVIDVEYAPGRTVTLKLEQLQHTGSFKPRGAFNSVLSAAQRPELLIAASGGNHGLAVAHVGAALGIPTEIFVPETAPQVKVDGIRSRGATVTLVGATFAEAHQASMARAAETGGFQIHAYDGLPTLTGQGTLGREIEQQVPDADAIVVAVGGGGLMGGIASWWAGRADIIAVEPVGCPTLHSALAAGEPVDIAVSGLAADSLGAKRIGTGGFAAAVNAAATSVLVTPEDILAARKFLWDQLRIVAEPGGAAALAAVLSGVYVPQPGSKTVVVVCGANTDPSDLVR
ncbi:threonine/serine dehydratase [Arthrobacter sp. 35W]|uniref:threonine/serine dehydratase n=1 Tax=Arthrobacter sp. 35W TaxID=1132441 RepID=UPI0003F90BF0|nr:threonine/serine dehydratase [Arthrobacter sp. 35W]